MEMEERETGIAAKEEASAQTADVGAQRASKASIRKELLAMESGLAWTRRLTQPMLLRHLRLSAEAEDSSGGVDEEEDEEEEEAEAGRAWARRLTRRVLLRHLGLSAEADGAHCADMEEEGDESKEDAENEADVARSAAIAAELAALRAEVAEARKVMEERSELERGPSALLSGMRPPPLVEGVAEQKESLKRRGLDRTWEVEAEREWQAREPPDGGRGEAMVAELRSIPSHLSSATAAPEATAPEAAAPEAATIAMSASPPEEGDCGKSSLRRLKQLDPTISSALEQECGVSLGSKSDVFRLVLENQGKAVRRQTKVLVVMAGESFLCDEAVAEATSEEVCAASAAQPSAAEPCQEPQRVDKALEVAAAADEAAGTAGVAADQVMGAAPPAAQPPGSPAPAGAEPGTGSKGPSTVAMMAAPMVALAAPATEGGCLEAELCFFRATPKAASLAKKLGKVPVIHVMLMTDDGQRQAMEFIGVHQRRYCAEEPAQDAIAQNLMESLLKVVFEFVFHPSRTKYAKERLVLRDCSVSEEALRSRQTTLPAMLDSLRTTNEKIRHVSLELLDRRGSLHGAQGKKDHSFLILDEDILRVAPVRSSMVEKPRPSKFNGLQKGFLNSAAAKRGFDREPLEAHPHWSSAAAGAPSSASSVPAGLAEHVGPVAQGVKPGERTRVYHPEKPAEPPPVQTGADDKRRLLLGGADVRSRMSDDVREFAAETARRSAAANRADAASAAATAAQEQIEEEMEDLPDGGGPQSLSDLANQLFGGLALDDEVPEENATAAEVNPGPTSGFRLLQQRRRERAAGPAPAPKAAPSPKNEEDELVRRWMKQRW